MAGAVAGLAAVASAPAAEAPTLAGFVGPGFEIGLLGAEGGRVARVEPGPYALTVADAGDAHNFHLVGPGVDVRTGVEATGTESFTVDLSSGAYRFYCDAHYPQMLGSFSVGTPLVAAVGRRITLTDGGQPTRSVVAATYLLLVRDLSRRDNLHLRGPGIDRRTRIATRGTALWTVRFVRGAVYTLSSDARRALRISFRAV